MNKLINYSPNKIVNKEIFKYGVDAITSKSNEDKINFTVEQLQKAKLKSE